MKPKVSKISSIVIDQPETKKVKHRKVPSMEFRLWTSFILFAVAFVLAMFLFGSVMTYLNFLDWKEAWPHIKEFGLNAFRLIVALLVLLSVSIGIVAIFSPTERR